MKIFLCLLISLIFLVSCEQNPPPLYEDEQNPPPLYEDEQNPSPLYEDEQNPSPLYEDEQNPSSLQEASWNSIIQFRGAEVISVLGERIWEDIHSNIPRDGILDFNFEHRIVTGNPDEFISISRVYIINDYEITIYSFTKSSIIYSYSTPISNMPAPHEVFDSYSLYSIRDSFYDYFPINSWSVRNGVDTIMITFPEATNGVFWDLDGIRIPDDNLYYKLSEQYLELASTYSGMSVTDILSASRILENASIDVDFINSFFNIRQPVIINLNSDIIYTIRLSGVDVNIKNIQENTAEFELVPWAGISPREVTWSTNGIQHILIAEGVRLPLASGYLNNVRIIVKENEQ